MNAKKPCVRCGLIAFVLATLVVGAQSDAATSPSWNGTPVVAYARLAPIDHLRRDLEFLSEGVGEQGALVRTLADELSVGVDPARSAGMALLLDETFVPMIFIPLKDEERLFALLQSRFGWQFNRGEDGLYRGLTVRAVARVSGSWLYVTGPDYRERLTNLPTDPAQLFEGSDPAIAAQLYVAIDQIPPELRGAFAEFVAEAFAGEESGVLSAVASQAWRRIVMDSQSWQVELQCFRPLEQFHMTARIVPAAGSELEHWIVAAETRPMLMEHVATAESTAGIAFSAALSDGSLEALTSAWERIDGAARAKLPSTRSRDPAERQWAKLATTSLDAASATIKKGDLDLGLSVVRRGNELVVSAGSTLDGSRKVEEAALDGLDLLRQLPDFQSLQWATGGNGDLTMHEFQVPADDNTQAWVGESIHLVAGFGNDRVYAAAGGAAALETVSAAIDRSREEVPSRGGVLRISLHMAPLLALLDEASGPSAGGDENLHEYARLIAPYRKNDVFEFNLSTAEKALEGRLRIDMGIVRMLAAAVPNDRPAPPPATVTDAPPSGAATLGLRMPPGTRFQLQFDSDSEAVTTIDDNERIDSAQYSTAYEFRVVESRRNGAVRLEAKLVRAALKKAGPDGTEMFDSENRPDPSMMTPEMLLYSAMVGEPFQMTVALDGTLGEFAGITEAVDRMVDDKLQPPPEERAKAKAFIEQGFNEKGLRDTLSRAFEFYPGKTVVEGDRWTKSVENFSGINFLLDNRYQLKSLAASEATMTVRSQIREKEADDAVSIRWEVLGTQTGTITVDPRDGRLLRAQYVLKTDAEATFQMDGKTIVRPVTSTIRMNIAPPEDAAEATSRPQGERTFWRHAGGHFSDHGSGEWAERSQNGSFELKEVARTADRIELVSKSGSGTRVRLFAGQSDILRNGMGSWERQYVGNWAVPESAERRVFWRHDQGFFDNVDGDEWLERSPNGAFHFAEAARTEDYVELRNTQTGTLVRLFADRCELKGSQQRNFQLRYQGGWEAR